MIYTALALPAFALAVLAAPQPSPACASNAKAEPRVRAVAEGIIAADNRRDIAKVLRYYAPDATLWPPNEAPVSGLALIRPRYEALFSSFTPELTTAIESACADVQLAVVRGRNRGRMVARGTNPTRPVDDDFVMLLRRDGQEWRIMHLAWRARSAAAAK